MKRRLPAEWEDQDGILLAWPHRDSDWAPILDRVEPVFTDIAVRASRSGLVLIAADDCIALEEKLIGAGVEREKLRIYPIPTNDTWSRDFGPLTVLDDGNPLLLDFGFNGWGLKFASDKDNQVTRRLHGDGAFGTTPIVTCGLVLEGGSIESDGAGTILTTAECLLGPNRNPHLSREQLEESLTDALGADRFLWLEHGYLAGDDTDSHIDTLARLCPDDTILHVGLPAPGDEHYHAMTAMVSQLEGFRTRVGHPYRLIPLPWPAPVHDDEGNRLPATYANFLVINDQVLVPTYRDPRDSEALAAVGRAFPGREIIGIDCRPLIYQHGSLHCVTMQIPRGVLP